MFFDCKLLFLMFAALLFSTNCAFSDSYDTKDSSKTDAPSVQNTNLTEESNDAMSKKELQNELFEKELLIKEEDEVSGSKEKAKLIITEYYSVTCKYCKDFHEKVMPLLKKEYIDNYKVAFVHRPLAGDQQSYVASVFSYCLGDKSAAFTDVLFSSQENWIGKADFKKIFERYAMMSGANIDSLRTCIEDEKTKKTVFQKILDAQKHLGVRAYPTYFIGHDKHEGYQSLEVWRKRIDSKLEQMEDNDKPVLYNTVAEDEYKK